MKIRKIVLWSAALTLSAPASEIEDVFSSDVLAYGELSSVSRCYDRVINEVFEKDAAADRAWERLRTPEEIAVYRERLRAQWPDRNVDFYHLNSSTDARHLQRLGLPMLIIGIDARGAHSPDEYVILSSLDEHADLIKDYLVDRFDGASGKE